MAKKRLQDIMVRPGKSTIKGASSAKKITTMDEVISQFSQPTKNERMVNLLWCVDKTGSMSSLIQKAKSASAEFFHRCQEANIMLNVCWCSYGDYVDYQDYGPSGLIDAEDWTSDLTQLVRFIERTQLVYGGDADEAVEYVLAYALHESSPIDAIILVADAGPHGVQEAQRQVRQYKVPTQWHLDWRENAKALAKKGIPVFTFAMQKECQNVFKEIARLSGGEMGDLDQLDALIDMLTLTAVSVGGGESDVKKYLERYGRQMNQNTLAFAKRLALPHH
jgi:hypothetical protein